jgi:hypothetical protein
VGVLLSAVGSSGVITVTVFVSVSGPRDDSLPEQWEPHSMRVYNQLPDHISEESHVESK